MIEVEKEDQKYRIIWVIKGTNILHREDGPAVEYISGLKEWHIRGLRHREDGPAVVFGDETIEWWLNDELYTKEKWFDTLSKDQKTKALYSEYFIGGWHD